MTKTNEIKFFKSAWGYEQTNIDFYVVVKETARTVTLVKVDNTYNVIDGHATEVTPDMDDALKVIEMFNQDKKSVETFRRTFKKGPALPTVGIDNYKNATEWQGLKAVATTR